MSHTDVYYTYSDSDGSAVELVGLCYSAVKWLASLHKQGCYPYAGVSLDQSHSQ